MNETFQELLLFFSQNAIYVENKFLDKVFKKFLFHLFINEKTDQTDFSLIDDISKNIQQCEYRDIFISEYLEKEKNYNLIYDFFIICFENTLIFIEQSKINMIFEFFSQNQKSTIHVKDENTKAKIEEKIDLPLKFSKINDNNNFNEEVTSFVNSFKIMAKIKKFNTKKQLNNLLKIIVETISIFLIQKSYDKIIKYDRIANYEDYKLKYEDKQIEDDEYIILRNLNEEEVINMKLIYYIEREEIYLLKIFIDEKANILFEREIHNYLNIHYPYFPKYFGKAKFYSYNCILIEYIKGDTLDNISQMNLDKETKIKIIFQIIIAIYYLHYNNFIYRDLKPNNIIINENKSITIIDFDRMIIDSQNYEYTKDFQHEFVAPEILEGKSFSTKSDIYSIGKIIGFVFENELSNKKYDGYSIDLYKICQKCTLIDDTKRPNIIQLIELFFNSFFTKMPIFKDIHQIKIENYIQNFDLLFYISEFNHPISKYKISLINEKQFIEDESRCIQKDKHEINQNNSKINFIFGCLYEKGELVKKDINQSIYYYTLAANQNDSNAQYNLGIIYKKGELVEKNIKKSIYYFTLAANQNDSNAQYNLGIIYEKGELVEKDIKKSIYYYTLAANQNDLDAIYNLGLIYSSNEYVFRDIEKSIYYLTIAANNNHCESQFFLGMIYKNGELVPQDINKSIHYLTLSANQNHLKALIFLGLMYGIGKYIPRDIKKSFYYINLAAQKNCDEAQYILGALYQTGELFPQDINKSIYYYTLAANQNNSNAQFNLGKMYETGKYVPRNMEKSIYYYTLAAKLNYTNAQYNLGLIYESGEYVPRDIDKSIYYYTLAANKNHSLSQFNLGIIYTDNKYIQQDIDKAIHFFTLAANQNNRNALYNLGIIYATKKFNKKDTKKSIYYFTLAANLYQLEAMFNLGLIYEIGKFIPQNITKAIHYYSFAAKLNHPKSIMRIGFFYLYGDYYPQDFKKALNYFLLGAEYDINEAHYFIGTFYFQGCHVNRDIDKAISHYKMCSSLNHQFSKNNLGIIYKNIIKNLVALEYFEEAIYQKNDRISMYNLGHIYFYGDFIKENIDKAIELFIKSSNLDFYPSKIMLSLAVLKKIRNISVKNVINELEMHGNKIEKLNKNIFYIILKYELYDEFNYMVLYSLYEKREYIYDYFMNEKLYLEFMNEKVDSKPNNSNNIGTQKNIDNFFYLGFDL